MKRKKLIIVCGLPGVGKTTVARIIIKKIKAKLLRTDVIRQKLFVQPKYTAKEKDVVYQAMFQKAEKFLENKEGVVLDATFAKKTYRQQAKNIANQTGSIFTIIKVTSSSDKVKKRISKRTGDASEADFTHFLAYQKRFSPIEQPHIVIDNSQNIQQTKKQIEKMI